MPRRRNSTDADQCAYCTLKMYCKRHSDGQGNVRPKARQETLDKLYDDLITSKLERMQPKKGHSTTHTDESDSGTYWKRQLEKQRLHSHMAMAATSARAKKRERGESSASSSESDTSSSEASSSSSPSDIDKNSRKRHRNRRNRRHSSSSSSSDDSTDESVRSSRSCAERKHYDSRRRYTSSHRRRSRSPRRRESDFRRNGERKNDAHKKSTRDFHGREDRSRSNRDSYRSSKESTMYDAPSTERK